MKYIYRQFETTDYNKLKKLIKSYYQEDTTEKPIDSNKIQVTISELSSQPEKGNILIIEQEGLIIGYCILINYWSNEYGGNLLHIDELYVLPEYREKGAGTSLIKYLVDNKYNNSVAIQVEVTALNKKAKKFYERNGFKISNNSILLFENEMVKLD